MDNTYEFSSDQNRIIADLASRMSSVGAFLIIAGAVALVSAILSSVQGAYVAVIALLTVGAFFLVTGVWSRRSARYFRYVVDTTGHDIDHIMRALTELDKFYTLKFWLVIAYLVIILSALVLVPSLG